MVKKKITFWLIVLASLGLFIGTYAVTYNMVKWLPNLINEIAMWGVILVVAAIIFKFIPMFKRITR